MRGLFVICFLFLSALSYADDKTEAVENLMQKFGAETGDIERLLEVRYVINDAIYAAAVESFGKGALPIWGETGALVVEFSDYQCGYCKQMYPLLKDAVEDGEARVVIVEFPILGAMSERAARVALAAKAQGRHTEFHELLMNRGRISEADLQDAVETLGLDVEQLQVDEISDETNAALERNYQLALLLGVSSTPSFIIDGVLLKGAMPEENLRRLLSNADK